MHVKVALSLAFSWMVQGSALPDTLCSVKQCYQPSLDVQIERDVSLAPCFSRGSHGRVECSAYVDSRRRLCPDDAVDCSQTSRSLETGGTSATTAEPTSMPQTTKKVADDGIPTKAVVIATCLFLALVCCLYTSSKFLIRVFDKFSHHEEDSPRDATMSIEFSRRTARGHAPVREAIPVVVVVPDATTSGRGSSLDVPLAIPALSPLGRTHSREL
ncbi:hypothetical protein AC1031_002322 [Aphanomyces cochlioides]|nr:hypothetical protein AC1031_002322 [Aphanomyces cochlioides]